MPYSTFIVTRLNRGQSVELKFTVNCNTQYRSELESEIIQIDELAMVRFKFVNHGSDSLRISMSSKQHNLIEDIPSIMNVTSKAPQYSEEWYCPKKWSEMIFMGKINPVKNCDQFKLYCFDVTINVSKPREPISFANIYEDTDFSDFHLSTVDGSVAVHRAVLAVHSDMFRTMLKGKWKEIDEGKVELGGASLQTLQHLKEYMYLGSLPKEGLQQLLILAKSYLIENLKVECIKRLSETVTPDNLYSLLQCACENNIPELTFEILHRTPSDVVQSPYELKKYKPDPKPENDE